MNDLKLQVACAAVLTLASPLPAQSAGDSLSLTLAEAIRLARLHNATYRQVTNDAGAAAWRVRRAYAALLPTFAVGGSMGYRGPGTQTFLTTTFQQSSATVSSSYNATLRWDLSGRILSQPGLQRATQDAVDADIASALGRLETAVTEQYLGVLQARANLEVQREQVARDEETLRLASARHEVGQTTRLDVRQAEVARGRSQVELLRLEQAVRVELLRLFRQMGVTPPADLLALRLADSLPAPGPSWSLDLLLDRAARSHPDLVALRARTAAARWGVRAARADYLPSLSVAAGWSGFTQQFTNVEPLVESTLANRAAGAQDAMASCEVDNQIRQRLTDPLPPADCSRFAFTHAAAAELAGQIRARNTVFPFSFTQQPFQASVFVTLPIFNSFSSAAASAEASAAREDAELAARERAMELRALVTERFHDADRAWRTIAIEEENRAAARDQGELATERYRLGQGSFLEVLESRLLGSQAERAYVDAVYGYRRAVVLLEEAVGGRMFPSP